VVYRWGACFLASLMVRQRGVKDHGRDGVASYENAWDDVVWTFPVREFRCIHNEEYALQERGYHFSVFNNPSVNCDTKLKGNLFNQNSNPLIDLVMYRRRRTFEFHVLQAP